MERFMKYLIIIASIMTVELAITESKDDKKKVKFDRQSHHYYTNVCDIMDRRSKVHCYCDNALPKTASWADCWVFGGGLQEDDPIWPSFSSQPYIEHLIFNARSDDALTFIPAKALIRLDKLKHLTVQFGTIKSIPPFSFTNSSTIREIVLKSNKINSLEVNSFAKLTSLYNLSLDDNRISELKRNVFIRLVNLRILHLSNNNITLIHERCFENLNNLVELKLDSNFISVVTKEMFEGLESLTRLDLRHNKLSMIGNLAFSELWALKELLLDNNVLEYISERSFGGLTQLHKLSLANNRLTAFYEDIIESLNSLVVLDLSGNLLDSVTYDTIRSVVENEKAAPTALYLHGNPLKCDCRLSWIITLRNETKDSTLRRALDKISCVEEHDHTRSDTKDDNTLDNAKQGEQTYEYYDEKTDEIMYDEPKKTHEYRDTIKVIDFTISSLPCPKELLQVDDNNGQPVPNEIRLKSFSNVGNNIVSFFPFLVPFVIIFL